MCIFSVLHLKHISFESCSSVLCSCRVLRLALLLICLSQLLLSALALRTFACYSMNSVPGKLRVLSWPLDVLCTQRQAGRGAASKDVGGGFDVVVGGYHFPTLLRPRSAGRSFTIAAPAFDAYVGDQLVRDGHWMPQEVRSAAVPMLVVQSYKK